jgi:fructose-1,6-bisphosphatase
VIKEIDNTGQYREHKQSSNSDYSTKDSVLFNLIDLGCINIKMMDEFLKIGIDPNEAYKGRKLLDSITYQLTKVVREPDFYNMPEIQKYIISPKKRIS